MRMPWYSTCSFLFFCLEPTLRKDTWMRAISTTVIVIFSKLPFQKLLDHNYVQSSFSIITKHIDNSILKDTLQLKILRLWIKIHANSSIKIWVNIIKWKSTKAPWKLSPAKRYKLTLENRCTKICDISLIVICYFFSQTNVVFKSNPALIDIFDSFCQNLFTFSLFEYWYFKDLKIYPDPLLLLYKNQ